MPVQQRQQRKPYQKSRSKRSILLLCYFNVVSTIAAEAEFQIVVAAWPENSLLCQLLPDMLACARIAIGAVQLSSQLP